MFEFKKVTLGIGTGRSEGMDESLQERFERAADLPEARSLPLDQRNTFARLVATNTREVRLLVTSPLPLGFEGELALPDGTKLDYRGSEPVTGGEAKGVLFEQRFHRYLWLKTLDAVTPTAVKAAYHSVGSMAAVLSLVCRLPVRWEDPWVPPMVSIISRRPEPAQIVTFLSRLELLNQRTRLAVETALGWYWNAQLVSASEGSVIFEFVCYWNVIEALAEGLGGNSKDSKEEKARLRTSLREALPGEDVEDAVKAVQYRRRAKKKIEAMLKAVTREMADDIMCRIFESRVDEQSLFDVRNKIAHGEIVTFEAGLEEMMRRQIWRLQNCVEAILQSALA